jgi:hypothetical protein
MKLLVSLMIVASLFVACKDDTTTAKTDASIVDVVVVKEVATAAKEASLPKVDITVPVIDVQAVTPEAAVVKTDVK